MDLQPSSKQTQETAPESIVEEQDSQDPPAVQEKTNFFAFFKPVQGYFITPVLININILIFVLMVISGVHFMSPDTDSLIRWGANYKPVTLDGQAWRLLTSCFLHIGILHLLMNMYALVYIGLLLEPYLGKLRFTAAYLLTGIAASTASLWWHDVTVSAGASGAIFGMYGVFLAMLTTNLIEKAARKELLASITLFVGYNLVFGLQGNIDNAAHIGGLLSGLVTGYALIPSLKKNGQKGLSYGTIAALTILTIAGSAAVYLKTPNDIGTYNKGIEEFAAKEREAMKIYSLAPGTSTEETLQEVNKGITYWKENLQLIRSFEKLKLPAELKEKSAVIIEYCQLRIQSYELIYKGISENTSQYDGQIQDYNKQIESKIKQLGGE